MRAELCQVTWGRAVKTAGGPRFVDSHPCHKHKAVPRMGHPAALSREEWMVGYFLVLTKPESILSDIGVIMCKPELLSFRPNGDPGFRAD